MANIGFDAKRAFLNFSGLGNYSRSLIEGLSYFHPYNKYYLYTPPFDPSNKRLTFVDKENIQIVKPSGINKILPSSFWRSNSINSNLKKDKIDLFHGLSGELPASKITCPQIVTMHDVIFLRYPHFYKTIDRKIYEQKFRAACKRADKIIAISKQTADDLINFLDAPANKIEIIYQGCDKIFYNSPSQEQKDAVKNKYNLPDNYILNVGTIEERKNLVGVIKALHKLPEHVHLVALGRTSSYINEVNAAINELKLQNRVRIISNASFADFPAIYSQAIALTYVSFFEGFGIPVLEGLTVGVPVITSNLSSMPEAGGDAAFYVNPNIPEEISEQVNMILSSPTVRSTAIEQGITFAENFKEQKVIENIYKLYKEYI